MTIDPTASLPPRGAPLPSMPRLLRWAAPLLVCLVVCGIASAQSSQPDVPRIEVFAGYSYLRYDSKGLGFNGASNLQGWKGMAAFNLVRGFGVLGEASGDYGDHLNLRDVLVGPQVFGTRRNLTFFGHLLFGKARSFDNVGQGALDTRLAVEAGGGVDWPLTRRFSIRLVQADYVHTHLFSVNQNNLQVSTGLVYRWGNIKWKPRKPPGPLKP